MTSQDEDADIAHARRAEDLAAHSDSDEGRSVLRMMAEHWRKLAALRHRLTHPGKPPSGDTR